MFHSRRLSIRMEPFLYTANNTIHLNTKHQLFHHKNLLLQFMEEHNQEFHKKFVFD
jgi:hypothetical protein